MQMAVLDFHTGLRNISIREAAVAYSLAYTTFQDALAGSQKGVVAYEGRQLLTCQAVPAITALLWQKRGSPCLYWR